MFGAFFRRFLGGTPAQRTLKTAEDVTGVFLEMFRGHGLPCQLLEGWIVADSGCLRAQAQIFPNYFPSGRVSVQVDLEVHTADGQKLVEASGGVGGSLHEAILDAVKVLLEGSFHVIFAAVSGLACSHCEIEEWEIGGVLRRVYCGPFYLRGEWTRMPREAREWFEWMKARIQSMPLSPGQHWLRLYHFDCRTVDPVDEALLDNETCPELQEQSAAFLWPDTEDFYSIRLFLIIADKDAPAGAAPASEPVT